MKRKRKDEEGVREDLKSILNIQYVSPHAPMGGKIFHAPRCGDCFCTNQAIHTHSEDWYLELLEKLVDYCKGLNQP